MSCEPKRASAYLYSQDLIKVVDGTPGGCRANIVVKLVCAELLPCWHSCVLTDHYQLMLVPFGGFCILQNNNHTEDGKAKK